MFVSNRGFGLMSAALALVVLVGCGGKSNPSGGGDGSDGGGGNVHTYQITTVASPSDGGEVSLDPVQARYDAGTKVTATAAPKDGYEFTGWSGASTSKNISVTVTMNGDKALTANFRKRDATPPPTQNHTLTINISPSGGGSVSRNPDQTSYPAGTRVTLTAKPSNTLEMGSFPPNAFDTLELYEFTGWSGAMMLTESVDTFDVKMGLAGYRDARVPVGTATIVMDGDKEVTANFAELFFLNTDTRNVVRNPERWAYIPGMQVTLTAKDIPGERFTGWSGVSSTNPTVTITMGANDTLILPHYTTIYRTLTVSVKPDGGGTVSPQSKTAVHGTTVTVTATPKDGYAFTGWSGASTSTEPSVTITMDNDKTLTANFERMYTLTVSAESGGSVSCTPSQEYYRAGTQVTVTAKPSALHKFVGWGIINWPPETPAPRLNDATLTFTMNGDVALVARFAISLLSQPPNAGE